MAEAIEILKAQGATIVDPADIPSVMGFVGYQLTLVSESQEFSTAIGKGLINAAVKLVQIRFLSIDGGCAAFKW